MKKTKPVVEVNISDETAEEVKVSEEETVEEVKVEETETAEVTQFAIGDIVRLTDNAHYSIDGRGIPEKFFGVDLVVVEFGIVPEIVRVQVEGENTDAIYVGSLFLVPSNK